MALDEIISDYFSHYEISILQRGGIEPSNLLDVAQRIQDISDSFQGHANYDRAKSWVLQDPEMLKFGDFRTRYAIMMREYGGSNREKVLRAIDTQPAFARRDHTKMIKKKRPLVSTIYQRDLSKQEMVDFLTGEGIRFVGQSEERDSYVIDVIEELIRVYNVQPPLKCVISSLMEEPYVRINNQKYSISQARDIGILDRTGLPNMYRRIENSREFRRLQESNLTY